MLVERSREEETGMRTCPKCGYIRKPEDQAPQYECPACGVIYDRYDPVSTYQRRRATILARIAAARESGDIPWKPIGWTLCCALIAFSLIDHTWGTAAEQRKTRIEREAAAAIQRGEVSNSAWNGSVYQVEQYLRARLHDPSSFEAVHWSPVQRRDGQYVVSLRYRAKNALGAMVVNDATFVLNSSGVVLSMSE